MAITTNLELYHPEDMRVLAQTLIILADNAEARSEATRAMLLSRGGQALADLAKPLPQPETKAKSKKPAAAAEPAAENSAVATPPAGTARPASPSSEPAPLIQGLSAFEARVRVQGRIGEDAAKRTQAAGILASLGVQSLTQLSDEGRFSFVTRVEKEIV